MIVRDDELHAALDMVLARLDAAPRRAAEKTQRLFERLDAKRVEAGAAR